jgi:hypothetical protein
MLLSEPGMTFHIDDLTPGRNHPTITDAEQGMRILSRFASTLEPPQPSEGYDKLITLTLAQQSSKRYSRKRVLDILRRLRDSPSLHVNPQ